MQRVHKAITGISTTNRSRVSNGSKLLEGVDGRSPLARRFRDLILGYEAAFEIASEFDKALIRQAAFLVIKAEDLQAKQLRGEEVNNDDVIRLSGQLRRVLVSLRRRAEAGEPIAPSFHDHLVGTASVADEHHDEHDGSDA